MEKKNVSLMSFGMSAKPTSGGVGVKQLELDVALMACVCERKACKIDWDFGVYRVKGAGNGF